MKSKNNLLFKCIQCATSMEKLIFEFIGEVDNRIKPKRPIEMTVDGDHAVMMLLHMGIEGFLV